MSTILSFNQWLLYYGDDVENMLDKILTDINYKYLQYKLLNSYIYYEFAKIIYDNSYKGRSLNIYNG